MPEIISSSILDLPYKTPQSELKDFAENVFSKSFSDIDKFLEIFDNTKIEYRNLCVPIDFFYSTKSFQEKNDLYIKYSLKYSIEAINKCLENSNISKSEITDIIFLSTTGIATPSIDAMIINKLRLNPNINRLPIWGLGCAGGVAGIAKAYIIAKANPDAVVLLVSVELCSLTFIRNDLSKSNFIATALFSDGVSAVLIKGDDFPVESKNKFKIKIKGSQSKLYYDSLDVMGWEILNSGFKVVFSKDIPSIVNKNIKNDILCFLTNHNLNIKNVKNFITHPGGVKVIEAYIDALEIKPEFLNNTIEVLKNYGNMSSATVLYVLDKFINKGFDEGYGLMLSLGPGFSSEMVLLETVK